MDHLATIGGIGDDRPIFDGWELLAAMAMATSHVRIGLLVTGITYRNPALLAKIATTVDHLSDGRLEFGIGAAWAANEHEMYGISGLDHRVGLFSEGLQVIRSLWTAGANELRWPLLQDAQRGRKSQAGPKALPADLGRFRRPDHAQADRPARRRLERQRQRGASRKRRRGIAAARRGLRGDRPRPQRDPPLGPAPGRRRPQPRSSTGCTALPRRASRKSSSC